MSFARVSRKVHRFFSVFFTLAVLANFGAMAFGEPPMWITFLPLLPLFLLFVTGAVLFALPYTKKGRAEVAS